MEPKKRKTRSKADKVVKHATSKDLCRLKNRIHHYINSFKQGQKKGIRFFDLKLLGYSPRRWVELTHGCRLVLYELIDTDTGRLAQFSSVGIKEQRHSNLLIIRQAYDDLINGDVQLPNEANSSDLHLSA